MSGGDGVDACAGQSVVGSLERDLRHHDGMLSQPSACITHHDDVQQPPAYTTRTVVDAVQAYQHAQRHAPLQPFLGLQSALTPIAA
eukprot:239035-Rhodomonas_salina.2